MITIVATILAYIMLAMLISMYFIVLYCFVSNRETLLEKITAVIGWSIGYGSFILVSGLMLHIL